MTAVDRVVVVVGARYGRWLVTSQVDLERIRQSQSGKRRWMCQCECGTERAVLEASLKNGTSRSCGCLQIESSVDRHIRHGETLGGRKTVEYKAWQAMLDRCRNAKNSRYDQYGGRGIDVCARWEKFECFLADMGRRPSAKHSLDRVDNDAGYDADNCRWAIPHEQMTNRSVTRFVQVDGQNVPLATLAKQHGVPANTLRFRILKGWSLQDALTKPVRPKAK